MYSEWTSLNLTVQQCNEETQSVLEKFGLPVSKEITLGLVRQLASNLGITQPPEPSPLITDKDVGRQNLLYDIIFIYSLFYLYFIVLFNCLYCYLLLLLLLL